jgi:HTH-type transcriptional regulator/antitoxin HigA
MNHSTIRSARATPPGATIKREILERGWTQKEFARILGRPEQFVSDLLSGKRILTPESAIQLEAALDVPAAFWLRREANYRLWLEQAKANDQVEAIRSRRREAAA